MSVKHRYRSIDGAVRRVRQCEKLIAYLHQLTDRLNRERILLARLAAETPQFCSPLEVYEAQRLRDAVLRFSHPGGGP